MFLWVVLFHDLSWTLYVLGCAATAGGMMALIASSHVREPANTRRTLLLLGAACSGAAAALVWGLSLPPSVVGIVALLMLNLLGLSGVGFLLRARQGNAGRTVSEERSDPSRAL